MYLCMTPCSQITKYWLRFLFVLRFVCPWSKWKQTKTQDCICILYMIVWMFQRPMRIFYVNIVWKHMFSFSISPKKRNVLAGLGITYITHVHIHQREMEINVEAFGFASCFCRFSLYRNNIVFMFSFGPLLCYLRTAHCTLFETEAYY